MGLLIWIIFGALAGWLASMLMSSDANQGTLADIALGVLGALIGGLIMEFFGMAGVTGFNLYSLVVAVVGACVVIYVGRLVRR